LRAAIACLTVSRKRTRSSEETEETTSSGKIESLIPFAPGDNFAAEFARKLFGFFAGAIHHVKVSDFAVAKLGDDLFADDACTKDERGALIQFAENSFGQFHAAEATDMGRVPSSVSERTRLPTSSAPWKRRFNTGPVPPLPMCRAIGFADLARISARQ